MNHDENLSSMHADAMSIFQAGIKAVAPGDAIRRYCRLTGDMLHIGEKTYDLRHINRILVVGAGKAAAPMAQAVEELLGARIHQGLICVKYKHGAPLGRIRSIEAGHPTPDANGAAAAGQILDLVRPAGRNDLVIVLLSGGGSALLPLPVDGISLEEKQLATDTLIACGATIHEINTVRKHLSDIKGGRLARVAAPAQVAGLILSDVVGDDLDVIASGPTVADPSTFGQCLQIIERFQLAGQMPAAVMEHLRAGLKGKRLESPKIGDGWQHVYNLIIGSNTQSIAAARLKAMELGYNTLILSSRIEGETRTIALAHGAIAREVLASENPIAAPACLLSGGETTVTVKGHGLGGRNQEFALAAATDIDGAHDTVILSGGTDGTDGPTDAAGAIADSSTVQRAIQAGLDIRRHLDNNDAYPFFKSLGNLLMTGPTQTNVMDLHVVLVKKSVSRSDHPDGDERWPTHTNRTEK